MIMYAIHHDRYQIRLDRQLCPLIGEASDHIYTRNERLLMLLGSVMDCRFGYLAWRPNDQRFS